MKLRNILRLLLVLLLVLLAIWLLRNRPSDLFDHQRISDMVTNRGGYGVVLFVLLGSLFTATGLPRQLVSFAGGYIYGLLPGVLVALTASILGCAITVILSRTLLRSWVQKRYQPLIDRLQALTATDTFMKVLFLRLQPLGTNLLTNLAAGVIGIDLWKFLGASLIGYAPVTMIFAMTGSGIRVDSSHQVVVSIVLILLSGVLGVVLFRRTIGRR